MSFGLILGIFLLLVGFSILLKVTTGIDLPIARIAFGLLLVYFGVRVMLGAHGGTCRKDWKTANTVVFGEHTMGAAPAAPGEEAAPRAHYQVVFGKGTIDLTSLSKLPVEKRPRSVEVNVVFGEATVFLDPALPVAIDASSVFGEARLPNGDMVAFGTMKQTFPPEAKSDEPKVVVHGNVVFGSLKFRAGRS